MTENITDRKPGEQKPEEQKPEEQKLGDALDARIEAGEDRPKPEWVRAICPQCQEEIVSNCYYVGGTGYLVVWECWASLRENPTCSYRKVL